MVYWRGHKGITLPGNDIAVALWKVKMDCGYCKLSPFFCQLLLADSESEKDCRHIFEQCRLSPKPLGRPLFWTDFWLCVLLSLVKKSFYWWTVTGRLNSEWIPLPWIFQKAKTTNRHICRYGRKGKRCPTLFLSMAHLISWHYIAYCEAFRPLQNGHFRTYNSNFRMISKLLKDVVSLIYLMLHVHVILH